MKEPRLPSILDEEERDWHSRQFDRDPYAHQAWLEEEERKRLRQLRPIIALGQIFRVVLYAFLLLMTYILAPSIGDIPLSRLTLNELAKTLFAIFAALIIVGFIFLPSNDGRVREAWGWFGLIVLFLLACGAAFLWYVKSS